MPLVLPAAAYCSRHQKQALQTLIDRAHSTVAQPVEIIAASAGFLCRTLTVSFDAPPVLWDLRFLSSSAILDEICCCTPLGSDPFGAFACEAAQQWVVLCLLPAIPAPATSDAPQATYYHLLTAGAQGQM